MITISLIINGLWGFKIVFYFVPLLKDNCKFKRTIFDSEELPESSKTFGKLNGTLIFIFFLNYTKTMDSQSG